MSTISPRTIRATYAIAHTARCKLQLSADRPDRDLRFILGHAFTLDKLNLRIAEIETSSSSSYSDSSDSDSDSDDGRPVCTGSNGMRKGERKEGTGIGAQERRVCFQAKNQYKAKVPVEKAERRRSPPPVTATAPDMEDDEDTDSDDEDDYILDDDEDADDAGLGLQRFGSATLHKPKILSEVQAYEDEEDAGIEDGNGFEGFDGLGEEEIKKICEGKGDGELKRAYERVAGCPCHGEMGPEVENFWEVPGSGVEGEKRMVVMQAA